MTTIDTGNRRAAPVWSRRPYIGTLPKGFQSTLPASEVLKRLTDLSHGPDTVGATEGAGGWLRFQAGPPLPATTLRLTISDDAAGARIACRFDTSRWDGIDLWVYTGAAAVGFNVAAIWFSGQMPPALRDRITSATPPFMVALALVALAHYGFRRWRQIVRNRLFDQVILALGVPIE